MPRTSNKNSAAQLRRQVEEFISRQDNKSFNYKQVSAGIGADKPQAQRAVAMMLAEMAFDSDILETEPGKYRALQRNNVATGTFVRRSNGKNSVITDDDNEAIFVAERNSMHALNGDRVKINIAARRRGQEPEAEVIEIIEQKDQVFIGTLQVDKNVAFLRTDSKFLACDIFIPRNKLKGGNTGDKAIVKITDWPEEAKNPRGTVVDILGKTGENNAEIHAILAEYGLPYKYPANVEKAADKIDAGITPEEIARREDFRSVTTFTIDPKDAKDFDDALSIRRLGNGNWEDDPDAALHYLARFLEAGDLITPCRRLLCSASEDVGMAYPQAISIVKACVDTAMQLGLPEAQLPLAQAAVLLATAPKSNSVVNAIGAAWADVKKGRTGSVPRELQNVHADTTGQEREQGYLYPHDFPGHWVKQQYLPDELAGASYYRYGDNKTEQAARTYWEKLKSGQ